MIIGQWEVGRTPRRRAQRGKGNSQRPNPTEILGSGGKERQGDVDGGKEDPEIEEGWEVQSQRSSRSRVNVAEGVGWIEIQPIVLRHLVMSNSVQPHGL